MILNNETLKNITFGSVCVEEKRTACIFKNVPKSKWMHGMPGKLF
jgi:hypothetical protein